MSPFTSVSTNKAVWVVRLKLLWIMRLHLNRKPGGNIYFLCTDNLLPTMISHIAGGRRLDYGFTLDPREVGHVHAIFWGNSFRNGNTDVNSTWNKTFIFWPDQGAVQILLKDVNSGWPRFSSQCRKKSIDFPVCTQRKGFKTSMYHKPTFTGQNLVFNFNDPYCEKKRIIR